MAVNIRELFGFLRPRTSEPFLGSESYWENRYQAGGNSGDGSYGNLAKYKSDFITAILSEYRIRSVVEFGCGDGNQLGLVNYENYTGLDVSLSAVEICRQKYAKNSNYSFDLLSNFRGGYFDLAVSLDVIYHLVEDDIYEKHMELLFQSSRSFVLIYSSNFDTCGNEHVRHRQFTIWVETNQPDYELILFEQNPYNADNPVVEGKRSSADFYLFQKI